MLMTYRDLCFTLCAFAYIFISSGITLLESTTSDTIEIVEEYTTRETENTVSNYSQAYLHKEVFMCELDTTPVIYTKEISNLEDYNCTMYATVSIGRYYITAYNHKETGSKMTASGKTCHEGTITTCAADPRYHKFGAYLEIDGRLYRVEDTGSAVKKRHIDLYFASYNAMARYGSNYQNIYKVEFPFGVPKDT